MSYVYRAVMGGWDTMPVGAWYSILDQTADDVNDAKVVTVENTDFARDIVVVDGSKFTVSQAGIYNLQFSIQLHNTSGGGSSAHAHIWFSKNGTSIPNSASRISVTPNNPYALPAWNYMVELSVGGYVEIYWSTNHANIKLEQQAASEHPVIPSVIVTMNQVG